MPEPEPAVEQAIRFCTAPDGVRIAYGVAGEGPALVRAGTWLTHLESDVQVYRHWLADLTDDRSLVRYDMRGCGLSDRDVRDLSLNARVADLSAVVDAEGLDRFALVGVSGGGPIAVAYAARHPERVSHLVLYGSFAQGRGRRARSPAERAEDELLTSTLRIGWGGTNPAFRRVFTAMFMPDASLAEVNAFDELQRVSAEPETAARIREASAEIDVTDLARQLTVPTLVLHLRDDAVAPFEEGRRLASLIPGARFVPLEGRNHIFMAEDPAWHRFVAELRRFLAMDYTDHTPNPRRLPTLTLREREVMQLVAEGLDNDAIAAAMHLSARTIERHLSNIYLKLGVAGKSARTAAAVRFARGR